MTITICAARSLGRSLRLWRAIRRVKQDHAAGLLHVSQATVSRWEAGTLAPTLREQARLRRLMQARMDGAADRALARLVAQSAGEVHLVCDLTHRLLAASPGRVRDWGAAPDAMIGTSLWRYATAEMTAAEASLSDLGWFEAEPPAVEVATGPNDSAIVPIRPSRVRWTRVQLSDGSFARLTETLA